jgi:hypothetical protein
MEPALNTTCDEVDPISIEELMSLCKGGSGDRAMLTICIEADVASMEGEDREGSWISGSLVA